MRLLPILFILLGGCCKPKDIPEICDGPPSASRMVFSSALPGGGKVDAGTAPDASSWKTQLQKVIEPGLIDHARLQTLEALLLATERLDAPFVTIGPAPPKYDSPIMLRVTAKFPGRRTVAVDHVNLSLALQQALRLGLGMPKNPKTR